jgi:hypothetical protein
MTAPGQEPDEVMTGEPGGDEQAPGRSTSEEESPAGTPQLDDIGDNHMPADMRDAEREKGTIARGPDDDSAD